MATGSSRRGGSTCSRRTPRRGRSIDPETEDVPLSRRPRRRLSFSPDGTARVLLPGPDDRLVERRGEMGSRGRAGCTREATAAKSRGDPDPRTIPDADSSSGSSRAPRLRLRLSVTRREEAPMAQTASTMMLPLGANAPSFELPDPSGRAVLLGGLRRLAGAPRGLHLQPLPVREARARGLRVARGGVPEARGRGGGHRLERRPGLPRRRARGHGGRGEGGRLHLPLPLRRDARRWRRPTAPRARRTSSSSIASGGSSTAGRWTAAGPGTACR